MNGLKTLMVMPVLDVFRVFQRVLEIKEPNFTFNFYQLCGELPIFVYKFSLVNFETRICALYLLCGVFYISVKA